MPLARAVPPNSTTSLCHVAAGFTDATMEIVKGFAVWGLSPVHYILHATGGVAIDLDGNPIELDYGLNTLAEINKTMGQRRKFIAAGNHTLAEQIQTPSGTSSHNARQPAHERTGEPRDSC